MSNKAQNKIEFLGGKAEQDRLLSRRLFLKRSLLGLATAAAMDSCFVEPRWLRLETMEVPIRGLPTAFDGYRIALLTDFHYPRWISGAYIQKAITVANAFQPDLM